MSSDEFKDAVLNAALKLDHQAELDTVLALRPWLHHIDPCPVRPCICGLEDVIATIEGER